MVSFIGFTFGPEDQLPDCNGAAPPPRFSTRCCTTTRTARRPPDGCRPARRSTASPPPAARARSMPAARPGRSTGTETGSPPAMSVRTGSVNRWRASIRRVWTSAQRTGTARVQAVTLSNIGSSSLQIDEIGVRSACCAEAFSVVSNNCPAPLAAGDVCVVGVQFRPATSGSASGLLLLRCNDPRRLRAAGDQGGSSVPGRFVGLATQNDERRAGRATSRRAASQCQAARKARYGLPAMTRLSPDSR